MTEKQKDILFKALIIISVLASITLLACTINEVVEAVAAVQYLWRF